MAVRILGLGTDIVSVARVAGALSRRGPQFVARILTDAEQDEYQARLSPATPDTEPDTNAAARYVAAQWAAKEAVYKALGGDSAVVWRDVEILRGRAGAPHVALDPSALPPHIPASTQILISISHEDAYATATALATVPIGPDSS